jgi:hypothetical protein
MVLAFTPPEILKGFLSFSLLFTFLPMFSMSIFWAQRIELANNNSGNRVMTGKNLQLVLVRLIFLFWY